MKKIGIFLPGKYGDIICATSVLKYKDLLWKDKEIIWFCENNHMRDILKYNIAISEIRYCPQGWDPNGPRFIDWNDFNTLKTSKNKLNQQLKYNFESTKDLEEGYFPAPWMISVEQRQGIEYPNISKKIFEIDNSLEWHPYLCFSDAEREEVHDFCSKLPYNKTIMIEDKCESGQSTWSDQLTIDTIKICRNIVGKCNFIFASLGDHSRFFDDIGMLSADHFTVRQVALINNYSDLFVGVASGISGAVNCWENKRTPKMIHTGSLICSPMAIANGRMEINRDIDNQFINKLTGILNDIK